MARCWPRGVVAAAVVASVAVVVGCGDDGALPTGDGGIDGSVPPPPGAPPVIPWLADGVPPVASPGDRPCPPGWGEHATETGLRLCDPEPVPLPACADDEAVFAGGAGCERIGTPCPVDDFPEDLTSDGAVRFVLASAAAGGNGSRERPFRTLYDAMLVARPGDLVAVGKGRYDDVTLVAPGVTVRGACVAETVLVQSAVLPLTVYGNPLVILRPGITIENLQVADAERSGITVRDSGAATIRDVLIRNVRKAGVEVFDGASADLSRVVIRDMRLRRESSTEGKGIEVNGGSTARADHLVIERAIETGVSVSYGATVELADVAVRDVAVSATGEGGGFVAWQAALSLTRSFVRGAPAVGIQVHESTVSVTDVVVQEVGLFGVLVEALSVLEGGGLSIRRAASRGLVSLGGRVDLEDVTVIESTGPTSEASIGIAISGPVDTWSHLRRVVTERFVLGLFAGEHADLVAEDVHVARPALTDATFGFLHSGGIAVQGGSLLDARRVLVEDVTTNALEVSGDGSMATLEDVAARRTRSSPPGAGVGLTVGGGSTAAIRRGLVDGVEGWGVLLWQASRLVDSSDLVVRGVGPMPRGDFGGHGIGVQEYSVATVERVLVQGTRGIGVIVFPTARLDTRAFWVVDTSRYVCPATGCYTDEAGHAFAVGGRLDGADVRVERAATCGLMVWGDGLATIAGGSVTGSAVGACLQSSVQTIDTISAGVTYGGNGRNLDTTMLPVPQPFGAF